MKINSIQQTAGTLFLGLLASIFFFIGYWPAINILVNKWLSSENYSHAFIVMPIIFYMIWQKRSATTEISKWGSTIGILVLLFAVPVYFFGLIAQVHTIIFLAMMLTIIGALIYIGGMQTLRVLAIPLVLFALLIPVPDQLLTRITFPLQLIVSQASATIISSIGIPIFREGNIISLPSKSFEVAEACSGMRSMMALITISIIFSCFSLRHLRSRLILLAASVPTAIMMNISRVLGLILLFHFFRIDLSVGLYHDLFGLVLFGCAIFFFFIMQRALETISKESN